MCVSVCVQVFVGVQYVQSIPVHVQGHCYDWSIVEISSKF